MIIAISSHYKNMKKENTETKKVKKNKAEKFNITSGEKIKHFMDVKGYKVQELADVLKKDRRTYFYKVKNKTDFTMTEAWILTKLFDCKLEDLIKDASEMTDFELIKYRDIISTANEKLEPKENKLSVKISNEGKSDKDKFNICSGEKIKHFMDVRGFTVQKLSDKLDKDRRTYFYKIKNITDFTMTEAWIMTELFGCDLDDLIKDTNEMTEFELSKYNEIIASVK